MSITVVTRHSMHMSVRGAILDIQGSRSKKTYLTDDQGRPLSQCKRWRCINCLRAKGD